MQEFKDLLYSIGTKFFTFAIVLIIGIVAAKIVLSLFKKILLKTSKIDHTVKTFLFSFLKVLIYAVTVLTAFSTVGVNVNSIVTALGAAALTAGLALQDTLGNLVSGVILLVTKPFSAGDLIEFDGFEGYVDSIRIFFTSIHTFDNKIVKIPNSKLTSNSVVNCSAGEFRRVTLAYSVSYEENITKVKSIIYDVISKNDLIVDDPEPSVYVNNYLDSAIEITAFVWTRQENYYDVFFYMQENVKLAFDEYGISIPYPHIVVKK